MISVKEALNIVLSVHKSYGTEKIELADATSRTLAEDIIADQDFPPFNRVAMDRIAIVYFDNVMPYYPIESRVNAGDVPVPIQSPGNCIEVMTGASLPDGCNCVVPFEHIEKFDDYYTINQNPKAWQNIPKQGQDAKQGNVLLKKGNQINAGNIFKNLFPSIQQIC